MIQLPLLTIELKTRSQDDLVQVWDRIRQKWVLLTPEEHVRQLLVAYLISNEHYPSSLMAIEKGLSFGHTTLRLDVVVFHRETHEPWMLIECKAPDVTLTDAVLQQLLRYHSKMPTCKYWLVTNGHQTFCANASNPDAIEWMNGLPVY